MLAADTLCAGLPALLDSVSASLAEARPMGLGVVRAGRDDRALLVYVDAFGSTGYFPRTADLPAAFRPRTSGRLDVTPEPLERNPTGLVESRLMHSGIAGDFPRPGLAQITTLPIAGSDPPAILVFALGSPRVLPDSDIACLEGFGAQVRELCERTESDREELERLRR